MANYTRQDGIKCSVENCTKQATWKSNNGPRCSIHNASGQIRKSYQTPQRKKQEWKQQGIELTYDKFLSMRLQQNNKCMVCHRDFSEFKEDPCVDHDHKSGRVRALLCRRCNMLAGYVESGEIKQVINYLDTVRKDI